MRLLEITMPSDETRRLLRTFGVAVTSYEDLLQSGSAGGEVKRAEAEAFTLLEEIKNHLERLRSGAPQSR
jgi:hypothetical protein